MTPPLATLLAAIRNGRQVCDEKLRRAWEAEAAPIELAAAVGHADDAETAWRVSCDCYPMEGPCRVCCDAIRAAVACPTWAELTRSEG